MSLNQVSEIEILAKLKDHDEQAFSLIYKLYLKKIYSFVLSIVKSPELAEDIVQETFVRLWEVAPFIQTDSSLQPYLFTIAKNKSLNMIKRAFRESWITDEIAAYAIDRNENAHEYTQRKQTSAFIAEAVHKLPPQRKLIYDLCHNAGYSYKQTAEKLGLKNSTVNSQMVKALKFIRNYIIKNGALLVLYFLKF